MCGSAPKPIDPFKTAEAQAQFNTQATEDALRLNAIDQYGPYGSTTYQRNEQGLPTSQTVNLSPDVKAWLDSQFGASKGISDAAQTQIGYLPQDRFTLPTGPNGSQIAAERFGADTLDPSKFANPLEGSLYQSSAVDMAETPSTQDIASTFYDQAKSRFQPDLEDRRKAKSLELSRRGIPVGSEIYNDEMARLDRSENNAYSDASRQAELAAGAEQSRQYGQNLSTAQYGGQEQQRLAGADLANRGFLGTTQNQQFNQAMAGQNFGRNEYQTELANALLERNQPYAEAAALLGTNPSFQTPGFQNAPSQGVAAPDYSGLANTSYNQQVAANQSKWNNIGAVASAAVPMIFSDEDYKENREPADGEDILDMFRNLPVDHYDYKPEAHALFDLPESRTGPMAQDYAASFGGDGHKIDLGDAVGNLIAAVKALDARTARQERY